MNTKTRALVLRYHKYTDSSLVVHFFTEELGRIACIVQGVVSKKGRSKIAYFHPLNQLTLDISYKQNRDLQRITDMQAVYLLNQAPLSMVKVALTSFVAEFLYRVLREEEKNYDLFAYVNNGLQYVEMDDTYLANFHLVFMLHLSKYIGIYPENNFAVDRPYFNLTSGSFTGNNKLPENTQRELSYCIHQALLSNFENMHTLPFNGHVRSQLLDTISRYYQYHLEGIGTIKSLEILKSIFH